MRLNANERAQSPGDYYTNNTHISKRARFVRLFSDGLVFEQAITLDQYYTAIEHIPVPR